MSLAYADGGLQQHYSLQRESASSRGQAYQPMSCPILTESERRLRHERFWNLPRRQPVYSETVNDDYAESTHHVETSNELQIEADFSNTAENLRRLARLLMNFASVAILCIATILYYLFMFLRLPFLCHVLWKLPLACRLRAKIRSAFKLVTVVHPQIFFWGSMIFSVSTAEM
jgi:hypothetical protein